MCFKLIKLEVLRRKLSNPDSRFPMKHFTSKHTQKHKITNIFPEEEKKLILKLCPNEMWRPSWNMKLIVWHSIGSEEDIRLVTLFIISTFMHIGTILVSRALQNTFNVIIATRGQNPYVQAQAGLIAGLAREQLGSALVYLKGPSQTHHDKACTVQYSTVQ